jgi:ferrochelatase
MDRLGEGLAAMRWQPAIRTLPPYYDDPPISRRCGPICAQLGALAFVPEVLLLSFHGMPERTLHLGDPYHCQCRKTARLLAEALAGEFPALRIEVAFQSRFGRAKWLEPSTEATLARLAGEGEAACRCRPGFAADCVETLEELAIRGRELFTGGRRGLCRAGLPQRGRAGHGDAGGAGAPRTGGLGLRRIRNPPSKIPPQKSQAMPLRVKSP